MAYSTITVFFEHYDDAAKAVRRLEATDIANMALFLASDDASYVTGATLAVNGGR